jgi:hypothetical protein
MLVTELGMVTEVKPLHPEKAKLPMPVTPDPIASVLMSPREEYQGALSLAV